MSRAEKDVICTDLSGVQRLVRFGDDIPAGWTAIRDADTTRLGPEVRAELPATARRADMPADTATGDESGEKPGEASAPSRRRRTT
jgi:hypothetical protein